MESLRRGCCLSNNQGTNYIREYEKWVAPWANHYRTLWYPPWGFQENGNLVNGTLVKQYMIEIPISTWTPKNANLHIELYKNGY
jgi:hypothetical protein